MDNSNQQLPQQPVQPETPVPQASNSSFLKTLIIGLGVVGIGILIGIGGYFLGAKNNKNITQNTQKAVVVSSPTPTPDLNREPTGSAATANWKTYTNSARNYQFEYPNGYSLEESKKSVGTFEGTSLNKDIVTNKGGGFGGGDALRNGVTDNFTIIPNKNLSEAELKSEFGSDITIQNIVLDEKNAIEVLVPNNRYPGRLIFYKYTNGDVLNISSYAGFETTIEKKQEYLNEFNQILLTFKFTQ